MLLLEELLEELEEGLVLPLELDELEDGGVSLGFLDPPLPHAANEVTNNANNNDLASRDWKVTISPPG